jgi:hypothetical protein
MKSVRVYDKPMCCSTGVCGPEVDPILPAFAADLEWLKTQGYQVARFNLATQPQAFVENQMIRDVLSAEGTAPLPIIMVDEQIVSRGMYPSREQLVALTQGQSVKRGLSIVTAGCGGDGCC